MSYLSRAKKVDLCLLVDELNLKPPENAKVIQLTDIIVKDANYNEEFVKGLLERIKSEREELESEKVEKEKRELELKKLELDLATARRGDLGVSTSKDPNLLKLMGKYEGVGDINIYLGLFERQIKRMGVAKENWVTYLLGLLPLEIIGIISRETEPLSNDYEHVKKILLNRFRLSAEMFRQKFFTHKKEGAVTWSDFAFELTSYLEEWISGLGIDTFDGLKQILVIDQIRRRLPSEVRDHFVDYLPKLTKLDDLVDKLDDYECARSNLKNVTIPKYSSPDFRKSYNQDGGNNKYNSQNSKVSSFPQVRNPPKKNYYNSSKTFDQVQSASRGIRCFTCNDFSHKSAQCPRKKDGPVCFKCNLSGHKSDSCPVRDVKAARSNSPSQGKILKKVQINENMANALIDSGSEVCMTNYELYVSLGRPQLKKNSILLSGISGSTVTPLGFFSADIVVDNFVVKTDLYVLENLTNEVILGGNFLNRLNFVMNEHGLTVTGIREKNTITVNYVQVSHPQRDTLTQQNGRSYAADFKYRLVPRSRVENSPPLQKRRISEIASRSIAFASQNNSFAINCGESVRDNNSTIQKNNNRNCVYLAETVDSVTLDEVEINHVSNKNVKNELRQLIDNYEPSKTKSTNLKMTLNLTDELPVAQRPRRLAYIEQDFVEKQVQEWLRDGIIRESNSNFASPIVLAKKKNGSFRLCIDYRKVNKKIIRDHYPLPLIEEILDRIEQAQVFTSLDLKNGFFHVDVDENSKKYTSFVTHNNQFEFNKVPFGISTSPLVFQKYICTVLRELIKDGTVLVYMDDVIIPAETEEEGLEKLKRVLKVASEYGLEFNFAKCQFLKRKIEFLGYVIENGTIRPSETKTQAVRNFPEPTNVKQLQSFLGLTSYFRKYIAGYAKIAQPLSDLLRSENKFNFGPLQREAFNSLKAKLADRPVLHIFKRGSKLELHTDASSQGFGAVLLQQADDGTLHPIHYMSRKTTPAQSKYCSYELEALAVVEALRKFRNYLLGTKIKIVTDCSAFQKTLEKKDLAPKVARWALFLQEFDYEIVHRSGKQMQHVDALSRNPSVMLITSYDELTAKIKLAQKSDDYIKTIEQLIDTNQCPEYFRKNDIVYKYQNDKELLVVPENMKTEIIRKAHEHGHFSANKTENILNETFLIRDIKKSIETVINNCVACILYNKKRGKAEGFLNPIPKQSVPLHTYHLDHVGPMTSTNKNYNHILTIVDAFTKFVWLYPTKSTSTKEVLEKLKQQSAVFGNPARLITDRGTAFTSHEFEDYCKSEDIEHIKITTGVPRGNGQVERIHKILIPVLSKLSIEDPTKWYKFVPTVQKILNSTVSRSTKFTPFQLLTGTTLRHRNEIKIKELLDEEYLNMTMEDRERYREAAKGNILKIQEENRRQYNKKRKKAHIYQVDDLVAIQKTQFGTGMKLRPKFLGPYRVVKIKGNDRYDVEKVGCHEGPTHTSTAADFMKSWCRT